MYGNVQEVKDMKELKEGRPITIWVSLDTYRKLGESASSLKLTRSRLASNLIELGLEDVQIADKLGLFTALRAIEAAKDTLGELAQSVKTVLA